MLVERDDLVDVDEKAEVITFTSAEALEEAVLCILNNEYHLFNKTIIQLILNLNIYRPSITNSIIPITKVFLNKHT